MSLPSKRSIEQYYKEFAEADRLTSGMGQLEFERTKRILQRSLPSPPAIAVDVGGVPARIPFGCRNSDMRPISSTARRGWLSFAKVASEQIRKRRVLPRLKSGTQDPYRGRMRRVTWSCLGRYIT
jgi:hypothetical protein